MYKNMIGLIGAPRSGTSWTGQIFDSAPSVLYRMQPFYSWAFRDKLHVRSSKKEIKQFFKEVYESDDDYLAQTERKNAGIYPIFAEKDKNPDIMVFKEVMFHYMMPVLLEQLEDLKIIAVVRHPIDVLTSYYNAPKEFDPQLDIQKEWYFAQTRNELLPERYFGYHKWKEYMKIVSVLKEKYGERVKVFRYEDLLEDTDKVVHELFDFSHITYEVQTKKFLYESQHKTVGDPYSVYRNINDKYEKKQLPENILQEIHLDLRKFKEADTYGYR